MRGEDSGWLKLESWSVTVVPLAAFDRLFRLPGSYAFRHRAQWAIVNGWRPGSCAGEAPMTGATGDLRLWGYDDRVYQLRIPMRELREIIRSDNAVEGETVTTANGGP